MNLKTEVFMAQRKGFVKYRHNENVWWCGGDGDVCVSCVYLSVSVCPCLSVRVCLTVFVSVCCVVVVFVLTLHINTPLSTDRHCTLPTILAVQYNFLRDSAHVTWRCASRPSF